MAQVTVAAGYDVDYYLDQVGVDYYLTADGEPPGIWAGKGAEALGLAGRVGHDEASKKTMRALFHYGIAPDGTPLGSRQKAPQYQIRATYALVEEAIAKRIAALGRFATPEEKRDIRLQERARMRASTPYYDMTFSAEKSVSLAYAGHRAAAKRARDEHREQDAERHEAQAERIEAAVMAGAGEMLRLAERRGAIVRTGHHSATSGEYRDALGFVAAMFPQHTSRADDPQLHVQAVILNKAQRDDGADDKWRALDGRPLWRERLGLAAHAGLREAEQLARLGLPLVKREDGNGFEIGGIDQATLSTYSGRTAQIEAELDDLLIEYKEIYGRAPDRRALFKLRKQVTLSTRKPKPKPAGAETPEDRAARAEAELVAWMRKARDASVQALERLYEAIEAYALEHPEALPGQLPGDAERARSIRKAIAEVQRQNSTWTRAQLEWELYRQMPVLPASADWCAYLDAMADDALAGRIPGTDVMRIAPIPDMVDVSSLDHRKDGASVYRPPGEERFACASHVDTEGWILTQAIEGAVPQLVTEARADTALAGMDLDYEQRQVVKGMLTSGRFINCLVAPAGTGKTHVMAAFARAWAQITGGRVIGLTLSENAARVMAAEGLDEAWNITRFFASRVPVGPADRLVIDEASQVSTVDWARISSLALQAGARVDGVGDTRQLGAVEAGGMFPLIAGRAGNWKLGNVRRFAEAWERNASLRLRDGDVMALSAYQAHGRIYEGPQDRVHDQAVDLYMLDVAQGKISLLLAGSNEEAATLARLVRERRIERGQVSAQHEVTLRDGNHAGAGDIVRARLNTELDAAGRRLTNRDTLRLAGFRGRGPGRYAIAERQTGPGTWSAPFDLPAAYLEENAELGYAGNVYVAQGATVDRARLVVSPGMSRDMFYVGMSRAREENTAHVVTGPADPAGLSRAEREAFARKGMAQAAELLARGDAEGARAVPLVAPEPEGMRDRAPWESVLAEIMHNDDPATSALEQIKQAQESVMNTRHLLELSEAFWWKDVVPQIDEAVRQRIGPREYERYLKDPERAAFLQELRAREIGGRRIGDSLDAITDRSFDGARSIAAVLHGRLGKDRTPERGQTAGWADRAPEWAPDQIRETQRMLDLRQAELGRRLAAQPPQWALERWGDPRGKSPALLADWQRRAAIVESYREAAGITDPRQAIGPVPANQAQLREAFHASVLALELPDNEALTRAMSQGQLEAAVDTYDQALAVAPASVEHELAELGRQHQAHAAQAQAAREAGDTAAAESASILAEMDGAEVAKLRVADAARAEWTEAHGPQAAEARRAEAELQRRGLAERIPATDAEVAETSARPRESPVIDPAEAARWKAEQTARIQADQEARAERLARLIPVTEAEIARYGAETDGDLAAEPDRMRGPEEARESAERDARAEAQEHAGAEAGEDVGPERAAFDALLAEVRAGIEETGRKIEQMPSRQEQVEAQRAAEAAEPGPRYEAQAQAEATLEPAWQPGEASARYEAEQDAEAEMEIEL